MTLAVLLFIANCCSNSSSPAEEVNTSVLAALQSGTTSSTTQSPTAGEGKASSATGQKTNAGATNQNSPGAPRSGSTSSSTSSTKKATTKNPHHNHRQAVQNCDNPAAGGKGASPSSSTSAEGSAASPGTAAVSCPPEKVVVPHGGTSEPSIQLAGPSTGDQATQQRQSANQLLGSTEENLKKLAGQPLNATQQDTVNQIHQFMEQSKTAVAAGDLERARTLAWKAQVLSQDLVSPQK